MGVASAPRSLLKRLVNLLPGKGEAGWDSSFLPCPAPTLSCNSSSSSSPRQEGSLLPAPSQGANQSPSSSFYPSPPGLHRASLHHQHPYLAPFPHPGSRPSSWKWLSSFSPENLLLDT